jgi:hypothetical protein
MFEQWSSDRPRRACRGLALTAGAIAVLLVAGHTVMAAPTQKDSSKSSTDRTALACKADIQRFCSEANLKQECLVARWDRISAECRTVLGTSAGNRADGGT